MKLYLTNETNPYYNLAAEEYLLRRSDDDIFMLWQNEPSVIIGKNQDLYQEVRPEILEKRGIHVARRITGGGAVYHDLGNVNYSFLTSDSRAKILDFAFFTEPIRKALRELGLETSLSGRNDLLVKIADEDGAVRDAKFSGNAETAAEHRILHHGTILFDSDLSVLSTVLKPDPEKLRTKAIRSVRSRVANLRPLLPPEKRSMTTKDFFDYLVRFAENEWGCRAEEAPREEVMRSGLFDRNRSADYNAGRRESFPVRVRKRFEFVIVVILIEEAERRIARIRIEGDFFGEKDVTDLCGKLKGALRTEEGLRKALSGSSVSDFISGMKEEELIGLLTEG